MTPLRQRMIQDLQLRGYSERTVAAYVHPVAQRVSRRTHTIALCGIKFFYQQTLGRAGTVLDIARPKGEKKLPVVLSRDEVWRVLAAVRSPVYRVCLTTIYACGLRLLEGTHLQVPDVDGERKLLHLSHGKGAKDRLVPLPDATLALLREHWRTHRNPLWLFPTGTRSPAAPLHDPLVGPISRCSLQSAFVRAVQQAGVHKRAHVHTLRPSYATHLFEAGVALQLIQEYLGHSSARTTTIYTHLTRELRDGALEPINGLMPHR